MTSLMRSFNRAGAPREGRPPCGQSVTVPGRSGGPSGWRKCSEITSAGSARLSAIVGTVRVAVVAPGSNDANGVNDVDDNGRDGSTSSNVFSWNQSGSTSVVDSSAPDAGACGPVTAQ